MVNNTAPAVQAAREARESKGASSEPFLAAGAVYAVEDLIRRPVLAVKTQRNANNHKRGRKVRDLSGDTSDKNRQVNAAKRHVSIK